MVRAKPEQAGVLLHSVDLTWSKSFGIGVIWLKLQEPSAVSIEPMNCQIGSRYHLRFGVSLPASALVIDASCVEWLPPITWNAN